MRMGVQPAEQLGGSAVYERSFYGLQRPSRTDLALSPDGTRLVFNGGRSDEWRLYLRRTDASEASPIPGTEGGIGPFFSPDGAWLGFWTGPDVRGRMGALKKVALSGGLPVTLCETPAVFGATWGPDDAIVFGQETGGLRRVSAQGGPPEKLTTLEADEYSHRLPQVLPGGEAVLFTVTKRLFSWDDADIVVLLPAAGERRVLIQRGADARHLPTGHLLFAREGTLMAAPFDRARLEVTGGSVPVIEGVMQAVNAANEWIDTGAAQLSVSQSGSLVYLEGGVYPDFSSSLVWVDRMGTEEPLAAPARPYYTPRLSPDGQRVAVATVRMSESKIWLFDISRGTLSPLTHEADAEDPFWTPDGTRITFAGGTGGHLNLFWMPWDGSGVAERLTTSEQQQQYPSCWSPDGRDLAFVAGSPGTYEIWVLPLGGGDDKPRPALRTPFPNSRPAFSPGGRWLAYQSVESDRSEVYVQPYPGPGAKTRVSVDGGWDPVWRADGRELFFRRRSAPPGAPRGCAYTMMAVDVTADPVFTVGKPRVLFEGCHDFTGPNRGYDVTPDGQRFLMVTTGELPPQPVTHINVVLNWHQELLEKVPVK